jgi:hypothetical protein
MAGSGGAHAALNNGDGDEEVDPPPRPRHDHRRASDLEPHHHSRREDDTPSDPIKLSKKGVLLPWSKLLMAAGAILTPLIGAFIAKWDFELKEGVNDSRSKIEAKLDLVLDSTARVEKKVDVIDERQRATERDVAALKAIDRERSR